jgi:hypothetical protein
MVRRFDLAWSPVNGGHIPFVVALAGGRGKVVQPFDLACGQLDAVGGGILFDAGDPLGARNRSDVITLGEQPSQRDLCRCCPASAATVLTSSTMRRLRLKFSPVKRGLVLRQSSSESCSGERISPVRKP